MELKEPQSGETSRTVLGTTGYWVDTNLGRHLDLNIGNSAYTWGYQDPELITALTNAMQVSFVRGRQGESCALLDRVNDQLCALAGMDTILWTVSGSDAVEAALEIAYQWHKKTDNRVKILNFAPGYHGTTWLAKAMRKERDWSEYVVVADAPAWNTNNRQLNEEDSAWAKLINTLDNDHNIGTIIIESLPWMAGVHNWSNNWWKNLRSLCTERGILLCIDDVAGGFGKVSAGVSHAVFNIEPDILALGKAITGGHVPLSCALAHKKLTPVLESIDWFHGHTWQPYVPGLAVVEKIIERVDQDKFDKLVTKFNHWIFELTQDNLITESRGTGLMRELLLTTPLPLGSMDRAGLVINGIPKDGLTIIVPQIADRRYWQELDTRVRNLLS
jgi:adenosylmethionine-8-amino-7-oxononanoate aminotransferase